MLSYRHAFHAGNHADVLKHATLIALLDYLNQKDKPYWYIDTHAGAGAYQLDSDIANKTAEYRDGIARLWQAKALPPLLARYRDVVASFNKGSSLLHYPGSPLVAQRVMRESDRLRLFELHPRDAEMLANNTAPFGRQSLMDKADGFGGLKSLMPPPTRRALTLIDPPFEEKQDYQRVVRALDEALQRFATGVYAVWYPCLSREESRELPVALKKLAPKWLRAELHVSTPASDGFGMFGSGMFILNPPYTLAEALEQSLPAMVELCGLDRGARYVLEHAG
ncbi:23S rRNA (adenine(2030)-N(6))-methyltransferase RlmJ [Chitinibacteraceae bacterium HSL-7]